MQTATESKTQEAIVTFDQSVSDAVERVATELIPLASGRLDDPDWISVAREGWHRLPLELRRTIARFRRHSGDHGTLLLRGLPVAESELPETPTKPESVQRHASVPAAVLMMAACGLGDPAAFRAEKLGALVQDVVPVPGSEDVQGNSGAVLLTFHNENAFHQHRPDYVILFCLRPDHERVAGLRTACIRQILPSLGEADRAALWSREFVTNPPPSFTTTTDGDFGAAHAVFSGDPADPDIRVDFAATVPQTDRATRAMAALQRAFDAAATTLRLLPGDMAIVDNRVTVHGRTAFTPQYDGRDRWLQRAFVLADLRRSRSCRPGDGHVLV